MLVKYNFSHRTTWLAALGSLAAALCVASGTSGVAAQGGQKAEPDKEYRTVVGGYVGMLEPYEGFRGLAAHPEARPADSPRVRFTGFLPFPDPHSSPLPVVVVSDTTDLRIRISGIGGNGDDVFDFRDVPEEIYRFWLSGPIESAASCTMAVEVDGGMVGRCTLRTEVLFAGTK